jgi:hypothetical protein
MTLLPIPISAPPPTLTPFFMDEPLPM